MQGVACLAATTERIYQRRKSSYHWDSCRLTASFLSLFPFLCIKHLVQDQYIHFPSPHPSSHRLYSSSVLTASTETPLSTHMYLTHTSCSCGGRRCVVHDTSPILLLVFCSPPLPFLRHNETVRSQTFLLSPSLLSHRSPTRRDCYPCSLLSLLIPFYFPILRLPFSCTGIILIASTLSTLLIVIL